MAEPLRIQFGSQSYRSRTRQLSSERTLNAYAERQPATAKSEIAVYGAPGIVTFATCGSGPVRAMRPMGDLIYVVSGGRLYSVTGAGAVTDVGGTISGSDVVAMSDNGTQIAIVNGTNGYVYSADAGFQLITDADFSAANTVTFYDGYFVFDHIDTNEFFISDSFDATSYSDFFASASWQSDNTVAVRNHLERLYVLGQRSTEIWTNVGAPSFPFQRIKGAGLEFGLISPHALTNDIASIYMVGHDRVAYRVGASTGPVSTPVVTQRWQDFAAISDASAFSYAFDGHRFVVFNFPAANETWVFDSTSNLWHERSSWDANNKNLGRWCGNCSAEVFDKVLIGDRFSGKIGYLDAGTFTEFGNTVQAELISPPIHANGKRVFMPWLELDVETGVGLTGQQGEDPQIMLAISDDGGRTWSDAEIWKTMGKKGQYLTQLRWDRLGSFYERQLKLVISDPVRRTILGARCPELSVGP